jgi:hypothetical protein
MKSKNPLYVVKGKDVQEVHSIFDLFVQRAGLAPVVNILRNLFYFLLEQVENFAMYQAVKGLIDEILGKVRELGKRFGVSQEA